MEVAAQTCMRSSKEKGVAGDEVDHPSNKGSSDDVHATYAEVSVIDLANPESKPRRSSHSRGSRLDAQGLDRERATQPGDGVAPLVSIL